MIYKAMHNTQCDSKFDNGENINLHYNLIALDSWYVHRKSMGPCQVASDTYFQPPHDHKSNKTNVKNAYSSRPISNHPLISNL